MLGTTSVLATRATSPPNYDIDQIKPPFQIFDSFRVSNTEKAPADLPRGQTARFYAGFTAIYDIHSLKGKLIIRKTNYDDIGLEMGNVKILSGAFPLEKGDHAEVEIELYIDEYLVAGPMTIEIQLWNDDDLAYYGCRFGVEVV